jgi:hypothetical protein
LKSFDEFIISIFIELNQNNLNQYKVGRFKMEMTLAEMDVFWEEAKKM